MNTLDQQIVLISTLDSKGEETAFLKELVKKAGRLVCVIDVGTAGTPAFAADITREEVAKKATTMSESDGPVDALAAMAAGAAVIVREMFNAGAVSAVAGIGGGKGSGVFHSITKDLPYGFPKVLVTSARPALLAEIATTTDTILLPTLVDLFGINEFTRLALGNAGKILAALSWTMPEITSTKRVAVTAFGVTTPAVQSAKSKLESAGITVIVFPANGAGGRTMEALIAKFVFDGVIDLTTTEMADLLLGGTASAGKDRLTAAGACGIPQIIAPGATDMVNFGPPDTLPEKYSGRTKYQHTPMTTLVRTTPEETAEIARQTAQRLNAATGPVAVFWPAGGVSDYDRPGQSFFDSAANLAWLNAMTQTLNPAILVTQTDHHINDPDFASLCAEWMIAQLEVQT
jgi:uncharacterized protein (UPF0261 family)